MNVRSPDNPYICRRAVWAQNHWNSQATFQSGPFRARWARKLLGRNFVRAALTRSLGGLLEVVQILVVLGSRRMWVLIKYTGALLWLLLINWKLHSATCSRRPSAAFEQKSHSIVSAGTKLETPENLSGQESHKVRVSRNALYRDYQGSWNVGTMRLATNQSDIVAKGFGGAVCYWWRKAAGP